MILYWDVNVYQWFIMDDIGMDAVKEISMPGQSLPNGQLDADREL